MARRTKAEVLEVFHHLYDCFDAYLQAFSPIWIAEDPAAANILQETIPRAQMLAAVTSGKATASEIVAGVNAGLADFKLGLRDLEAHRPEDAAGFHQRYVALRGKRFLDDLSDKPA